MSIYLDRDSKVIVQGITGRMAQFHTKEMLDYGTNVVGGVVPGKGGEIKVHYDINRPGQFTKTITVTSNAKSANETLKITGNVNEPAEGAPVATPAEAPKKQ